MLGTQEHYDLIAQFDRQFKGRRLDKEDKSLWRRGVVYQDGHVNHLYDAFIRGYALGKAVERSACDARGTGAEGQDAQRLGAQPAEPGPKDAPNPDPRGETNV